jgi:diguanylate cyclase (GGDEF)-like protein
MAEKLSQLVGLHQGYKVRQALETEARLHHQAHHDALTGLPNRVLLLDRIEQAMERVGRHGHSLGLLFTDLDGFKAINDSLGHDAGDRVLVEVANRLSAELRDCDTLARLGGDEFVILAEAGTATEARAALGGIAERVIETVARPLEEESGSPRLGTSVGIVHYALPEAGSVSAEQLLREADAAMYEAKRTGRNRYAFASDD